jgi:acyl carrier protein
MTNSTEEKIKQLMSIIFEIEKDAIQDDFSPNKSSKWDSLRHLNLIVALEEEFELKFTDKEIIGLNSYKEIMKIIINKNK